MPGGVRVAIGADARQREGYWTVTVEDASPVSVELFETLDDVLAHANEADAVGFDVPIGHDDPMGEAGGRRAPEAAAEALLGDAIDRILPCPPPVVFELDHFHQAQKRCEDEGWPELTRPIWGGRGRIAGATEAASEDARIVEAHPEVSFTVMNEKHGGSGPPEHYGDGYEALVERTELLEAEGWAVAGTLEAEDAEPRKLLDAAATAWTADRVARGIARTVPEDPPEDPRTGREVCFHA